MSFVGRIIAGARDLSFGGPLGILLDRVAHHIPTWHAHGVGESRDGDPRRRVAFTIAVIALGAKMAQADGAVTRDEVAAFREVFQVPPGEEDHVRLVFHIALADGRVCPAEDTYLREVARHFGFHADDYARIRAHHVGAEERGNEDPRAILGVGPDAS